MVGDAADGVQRVAVGAGHVHDHHVGGLARHGFGQRFTGERAGHLGGAGGGKMRLDETRPLGFAVDKKNLQSGIRTRDLQPVWRDAFQANAAPGVGGAGRANWPGKLASVCAAWAIR